MKNSQERGFLVLSVSSVKKKGGNKERGARGPRLQQDASFVPGVLRAGLGETGGNKTKHHVARDDEGGKEERENV